LARCSDERQVPCSRGGVGAFFEPEYAHTVLAKAKPTPVTMLGEQYAVAAVVYSLLTGGHYLELSLEQVEMFGQICTEPPIPLAHWKMTWWPEVEPALHRALEKESANRYPSVGSFSEALRRAADARQARLRPYSPVKRSALPKERGMADSGPTGAEVVVRDLVQTLGLHGDLIREKIWQAPACSLSHGAAGVGYGLYQLACRWQDAAILALADIWANQAVAMCHQKEAFNSPEDGITAATVGTTSPFHTVSGVHCVRALVSHAMGDLDLQQASIKAFLAASEGSCSSLDVTLGWSGTLLACTILMAATSRDPSTREPLRSYGDLVMRRVWDQLNCYVPLADAPPIGHLGVAHGWSGMAYAAMRWCRLTGQPMPGGLEERLQQLAELAEPVSRGCRWPWLIPTRTGRKDSVYMPGWCNGSAGYVHVWVLAHQMFGDERYFRLAEQAGWNTFEEPGSEGSLCCGLAGRAYGLLCLYKHTQDREWLARASSLGTRALISTPYRRTPAQSNCPQALECRRHSLYKGELGLAVLLADLSSPDEASMPFFEPQDWPETIENVFPQRGGTGGHRGRASPMHRSPT
jgi:serine/threonine-protein kinase